MPMITRQIKPPDNMTNNVEMQNYVVAELLALLIESGEVTITSDNGPAEYRRDISFIFNGSPSRRYRIYSSNHGSYTTVGFIMYGLDGVTYFDQATLISVYQPTPAKVAFVAWLAYTSEFCVLKFTQSNTEFKFGVVRVNDGYLYPFKFEPGNSVGLQIARMDSDYWVGVSAPYYDSSHAGGAYNLLPSKLIIDGLIGSPEVSAIYGITKKGLKHEGYYIDSSSNEWLTIFQTNFQVAFTNFKM